MMDLMDVILAEMDNFCIKYGIVPNTIIGNKRLLKNELEKHVRFIPSKSEVNKFADMDIIDVPSVKKYIICLKLKEEK